jgi:hypothetical protein
MKLTVLVEQLDAITLLAADHPPVPMFFSPRHFCVGRIWERHPRRPTEQ